MGEMQSLPSTSRGARETTKEQKHGRDAKRSENEDDDNNDEESMDEPTLRSFLHKQNVHYQTNYRQYALMPHLVH
jgi:hypothetical protein